MKSNRLTKMKGCYEKLIGLLLISLIFPAVILAQEPEGILLLGLFTDSSNAYDQEILSQGAAKTFNVRLVWTYDKTDIITGPLEAFAAAKGIARPVNGLEEPLLSEISGYQQKVIAHSAGATTAVTLAEKGIMWGDKLYIVSPAMISQEELRTIRDLTTQGKGFNKIVLYTGDDMIPNFKEFQINLKDYTIKAKITENSEVSLIKLVYEDRGQEINVLKEVLNDFITRAKAQLGKEPVLATTYGDIPGNKFEIKWEDGSTETFYLQRDAVTGENFYDEAGIKIVPLYEGFPHGRSQLEILEKFYKEYKRMPENNKKDIEYFKQSVQKIPKETHTAHDPNELSVSPLGDVKPGDTLTYTINYENEGEGIVFGAYITDTLDEDLDDTTLEIGPVIDVKTGAQIAPPGTYNPQTRTITWFVGEVGSGKGGYAELSVNVKNDAPDGAEVINYATVYFPSVPEETRTNGVVSKVTTVIDKTPPTTTATISPSANSVGWNNTDVNITLTAMDNEGGMGVAKIEYSFDGANWITYASSFSITTEGTTAVYYKSIDNAGNVEPAKTLNIKIDKTLPTITATISPEPNSSGWNNSDVIVTFSATDNLSGVATVSQPIITITEGTNQNIGGEAIDVAGNIATTYVTLNIDKTKPQVSIISPQENQEYFNNENIPLNYTASDDLSGISSSLVTLDGVDITGETNIQTHIGNHLLAITTVDKAGNQTTLERNFTVKLKAEVSIKPEVFLENNGIFIALVKFPSGYNIRTMTDAICDGAPSKKIFFLSDLAILFFRKEDITESPIDTTFILRGHFNNGLVFEGTDTIKKVIKKGSLLRLLLEKLKQAEDEELRLYKSMANF